jgi:glycerophosphoryl diester phosphodiesterase
MKIIAHRGLWDDRESQNTITAFKRALDLGFGIEFDVRDSFGQLVISHDPTVNPKNQNFEDVVDLCSNYEATIAINVKSDGILPKLLSTLGCIEKDRYFVFDMSIPETIKYLSAGVPTFMRISEFEQNSLLHENSSGIWLDAFESEWWINKSQVFQDFKALCVVSPELHGRVKEIGWRFLRKLETDKELSLCTDYPVKASEFFR